jgi:flavin reductase (DIM6/NTAB) family NADH-FMN oxidoreductase RutF
MKTYRKKDYPLAEIRRYLEPGPILLVSSAWQGKFNVMTMGWHMMMQFTPALWTRFWVVKSTLNRLSHTVSLEREQSHSSPS